MSRADAERERLRALASHALLDTLPEPGFDEITRLASSVMGTRSAALSLIDDRRQWFKSRVGIDFAETPRDQAICDHVVADQTFLEVGDASSDPRFAKNPLITAANGIRFYAGAPLILSSGYCLGSLCVFDPSPRGPLSRDARQALMDLARLAVERIEKRQLERLGKVAADLIDAVADAVVCVDENGNIAYWNKAAVLMFGRSVDDALGLDIRSIMPAADRRRQRYRAIFRALACGTAREGEIFDLEGERASGGRFPIELSVARWMSAEDEPSSRYAVIIRDVTERRRQDRENAQTRLFLDAIVANLPAMLFVKDSRTRRYELLNRTGEELLGLTAAQVVGRTDRELFSDVGDAYHERDGKVLAAGGIQSFESDFRRHDGRVVRFRTKRIVLDGPERSGQFILGMSEDVTEMRRAEARILQMAHYDSLTGLQNRARFLAELEELTKTGAPFAVLTVDLDRFKAVNDQLGHLAGDQVLIEVARRLREASGKDAFIARVGGDEFTVILRGDRPSVGAERVSNLLVRELGRPYQLDRFVAHTGASVGIVLAPSDGNSVSELRQAADLAMYRAKASGGNAACFFSPEMDQAARDRVLLENDLRHAVERKQIEVAFQPILAASSGQITSFEALARWTHPTRGPIAPDLFISIAEECGLVSALGEQVLEKACREASAWKTDIRIAVNLSPMQFETGDLVKTVSHILAKTGLAASRLQLEVTEGLVLRDVQRAFSTLTSLRALGIGILMDDFGVGYSSLSYFEQFPFDKVKIDRSFVAKFLTSPASAAIIEAVVGLGRRLDMGIVAEGVETEEQMQALIAIGCTHLQGYLISRPRPATDLADLTGGNVARKAHRLPPLVGAAPS